MGRLQIVCFSWLTAIVCVLPCVSSATTPERWIATWGSSQMRADGANDLPKHAFDGATLRQTVRISIGGPRLRLRLSNAFGERPLVLRSVFVTASGTGKDGAIDSHPEVAVLFHGSTSVLIPAGAEYVSDAVVMTVLPLSEVTVTMLIERAPGSVTSHPGARATSFLASGDHVREEQFHSPESFTHWYFLAGVEVQGNAAAGAIVALGDSITDGHGASTDANERWTDVLAARLSEARLGMVHLGMVNRGIGGNRVLQDGLGPNALARFDRDVLATAGARYLVVLEGINDLGGLDRTETHSAETHDALVKALETALFQIVERSHSQGITVFGGTLAPFSDSGYYHPSAQSEADRNALNRWIRSSGVFDAVIDFDQAMRDPSRPDHLDPTVDSGDHLHPNAAGYRRMGELLPLSLFGK